MTPWTQVYSPVMGNIFISALVAALPVFVLLGFLAKHVKAHYSAILGLITCLAWPSSSTRCRLAWPAWPPSTAPCSASCPSAGSC